ncbi:MAG: iron chelate uptake ABC transporter family permease subunit [Arenicellales bacterium]
MDEFILRALLGGIGIALLSGPLGCLVVWQRMSYFGAALSHAALLGIALGFFLQIDLRLSMFIVAVFASVLLLALNRNRRYSSDTILGVLAHGTLALGLVLLSLLPSVRVDLLTYLFGDILSISWEDIIWIYAGGAVLLGLLALIWRPMLALTLHRDLAIVDGVNETKTRLIFLILLSFVVAISMQVVGVLLIVSLLIIPAATARRFAQSPERMAMIAAMVGVVSVILGIGLSLQLDTPTGPSVVLAASSLFALSLLFKAK